MTDASGTAVLYRVTALVPVSLVEDWYPWMVDVHIPQVLACPGFTGAAVYQVVAPDSGDAAVITYVIDYQLVSQAALSAYQSGPAPALQKDHRDRYGTNIAVQRQVLISAGDIRC